MNRIRFIFIPFRYLQIEIGDGLFSSKRLYDFTIPFALSIITVAILYSLSVRPTIFSSGGILDIVQGLVQQLFAFFVAALAAVATFNSPKLDEKLDGAQPVLWAKEPDIECPRKIDITRRKFLSYLFGYLSACSLLLFIIILFGKILAPFFAGIDAQYVGSVCKFLYLIIFFSLFWNLLTTTMIGLYYLTEKIHK